MIMNQEKISKLIKEIRKQDNLTQKEFAEKYNVSFQAVSKWENGKSIPDIYLLKKICNDHKISIDGILEGKKEKSKKVNLLLLLIIFIVLVLLILIFVLFNHKDSFEFKTISTNCNDFEISGSLAYNKNKSYLHLSSIEYCGEKNNTVYKIIECTLYENNKNIKKELESYHVTNSTLEVFLKNVKFDLDSFSNMCNSYTDRSLMLEINATDQNDKTINFKIPLSLDDSCTKKES